MAPLKGAVNHHATLSLKGVKNHKNRLLYRKAIEFYLRELSIHRLSLTLNFKFHDFSGKKDYYGFCWSEEAEANPRTFWIEINRKLPVRKQLSTIAHELVHVRQFARNELYDVSSSIIRWKKEEFDTNNIDYADYPWEHQAHVLEDYLCNSLIKRGEIDISEFSK